MKREKDTRERKKKETESEDWGKINQDRELLRRRRNQRKMEGEFVRMCKLENKRKREIGRERQGENG